MSEKAKFSMDFEGTKVVAGYDGNADGEKSASINLDLKEVYEELMNKGEAELSVKAIKFKREGTKVLAVVDTDGDDQGVLNLTLDLGEAMEEAIG